MTYILQKAGWTKNYPPFYKTKTGFTPPFIKQTPLFIKRKTGVKRGLKLYKLYYKSEKPFLIKAFLLWAILELTRGRPRASKLYTGDSSPN